MPSRARRSNPVAGLPPDARVVATSLPGALYVADGRDPIYGTPRTDAFYVEEGGVRRWVGTPFRQPGGDRAGARAELLVEEERWDAAAARWVPVTDDPYALRVGPDGALGHGPAPHSPPFGMAVRLLAQELWRALQAQPARRAR